MLTGIRLGGVQTQGAGRCFVGRVEMVASSEAELRAVEHRAQSGKATLTEARLEGWRAYRSMVEPDASVE